MANISSEIAAAQQAKLGILLAGILVITMMIFGSQRQLVAQQYLSALGGSTTETELISVARHHSPTVEIVTQLQHTQQALYKAEVLTGSGDLISEASQDVSSRNKASLKRVEIPQWPDPNHIKVRLTVASQNITAAPPDGVTADQIPVIFEVNVYRQWLDRRFLWPALVACVSLWGIVALAEHKAVSAA